MEGFLRIRMPPWLRRLSTRLVAVVPAAVVAGVLKFSGNSLVSCLPQSFVGCYLRRDAFIPDVLPRQSALVRLWV